MHSKCYFFYKYNTPVMYFLLNLLINIKYLTTSKKIHLNSDIIVLISFLTSK